MWDIHKKHVESNPKFDEDLARRGQWEGNGTNFHVRPPKKNQSRRPQRVQFLPRTHMRDMWKHTSKDTSEIITKQV